MSLDTFIVHDAQGQAVALADLSGKTLLIVNTASKCGFTKQFAGLQALHDKYKDAGLVIMGFPCNQFLAQEPGDAQEAMAFCQLRYDVDFMMMEKVKVNGKEAHPLFLYLRGAADANGKTPAIKWNFTKFLVDKQGSVQRFEPKVTPEMMEDSIKQLLDLVEK
ncbi:glutathione peroxidase [Entomospira culicis]|uniref:Glutathione peroxidase n=1 Tax=Entomospira culicis TaxID=2719989 RepID=A0A968KVU5_9SPIO|nr:glutathione peroxidase [Entomospira culicis]NIZ19577.1 glutathione peroxidase [Entomospira culicis]NIZ69518.1 glutathione peroxidase [Entomospira culicis]WDI36631.1 glutathione peroxidase [Entomospira culicis]WDI38260.1 glutathione peroxidase [Entomospira culicis]